MFAAVKETGKLSGTAEIALGCLISPANVSIPLTVRFGKDFVVEGDVQGKKKSWPSLKMSDEQRKKKVKTRGTVIPSLSYKLTADLR